MFLTVRSKYCENYVFKKDLSIYFFTLPLTLASCRCKILCQIVYIFTACQPLDGKFGRLPKRCLKFGSPLFMLLLFVMADWMLLPLLDLIFSREKTKAIMHHHRTLHHEYYPKLQKHKIFNMQHFYVIVKYVLNFSVHGVVMCPTGSND